MTILIIEDEPQAAKRIEMLLGELIPAAKILAKLDTVKKSVAWLQSNEAPDLITMDVQLADGISFEIFERCEVKAPVIFTTAYDAYALKAFKVNSIDYILKPIDKEEFNTALQKVRSRLDEYKRQDVINHIGDALRMLTKKFKTRFVIKVGEHLRTVDVSSIRFFYSQDKTTFCVTDENRNFILDYTLEQLEDMIDPTHYYRINRKYLVSSASIQDIISYTNSRLKLVLKGSSDNDVIVARERVQDFKNWLDK